MSKKSAFSIRNLCRTCMTPTARDGGVSNIAKQQHIFEKPAGKEEESPTIMEILVLVQPQIEVQTNDDLPKIMCNGCVEQLQLVHRFLEMYKEANEKLHKLLKEADFNDYKSQAESEEFEAIEYDDTEREHIKAENVILKYEVEGEEISDHMPTELDENHVEVLDWPVFKEESTVHDISLEDEGKTEFFDNPYSDAGDSEWPTTNIKRRTFTLKPTHKCVVRGCGFGGTPLFSIKRENLLEWKSIMGFPPTQRIPYYSLICGKHFAADNFINSRRLQKFAKPTLFLGLKTDTKKWNGHPTLPQPANITQMPRRGNYDSVCRPPQMTTSRI